jgi:CHAT domain-containing protein
MRRHALALAAIAFFVHSAPAAAQKVSVADTFRIGSGGGVLCTAQSLALDAAFGDMFDRGYAIVCRDAAVPVGHLYALKARGGGDPADRLAAGRAARAECDPAKPVAVEGLGEVQQLDCRLREADVGYRVYQLRRGRTLYAAQGLAGYDSALLIGLRSVVADAPAPGEVSVATTGAGDPAAFARVQAGTLNPGRALAEAYRRNNAGNYAESAEFFATVSSGADGTGTAEALVNEALQKSNLGSHAEADRLFARAGERVGNDPVVARQLRNYTAMHLLNQGKVDAALAELDKSLGQAAALQGGGIAELVIDPVTAARLNAESPASRQLGSASSELLPQEKAQILDGQAAQLRGAALRLKGEQQPAAAALTRADAELAGVRGGRVTSVVWMRAQILAELGAIAEGAGDAAEAERQYRASVALAEANYPASSALLSAQGRLAGYLARSGRPEPAAELFRQIVRAHAEAAAITPSLGRVLAPYLELLLARENDPAAVADFFEASQVLVRPGVAQTQAVLARELSGGSDEAARLFRQSVTLTRQIERSRTELARLETLAQPSAADAARMETLRASRKEMEEEQTAVQAKLAVFPRFRALSAATISLVDLQQQLRAGEAYYKMTVAGDRVYALFATPENARAFRLESTAQQLDEEVRSLRETIVTIEKGAHITYPFNVELAHHLYGVLFAPVSQQLAAVTHLVFEPDGAMLRLPPNLLVVDRRGIDAYRQRAAAGGDAEYDFTGLSWLGREKDISTSVSARAFRDVRQAPRASASREYIGFGENSRVGTGEALAGGVRGAADRECVLSLDNWNRPISAEELRIAQGILAPGRPQLAQVVTGDAFTDTAIKARGDLHDYRIIHFATHGIVTATRRQCAAQPALMTSFGGQGSDGLLTFREIFDLDLDADLVVLSACDTAGLASVAATREAGLATGGDFALDGLVRAFVGAGTRMVIASHWPVPDEYNATQRLIAGLFRAHAGVTTGTALRQAEQSLMNDPLTSHPFYWSGFAIIGDGTVPVVRGTDRVTGTN